ncbi:carbon catabolite repressor protein 4 homolog 3-like isoform X1 [Zingiber officinale]|uniref:carbon catabolite repressor protein 4 homolog 3-like isoform X1 n=1 Tax=Zingiber officinale TaxID=94328 RepID=UPI001C4C0AF1|nr:carbon catabolite repressor protein 4 homolog 3-like isoform X1 [Zingiber officinale]
MIFADADPFVSQGRRSSERMWHEVLCFRSTVTPLAMMSHRRSLKCVIPTKRVPACCVKGTPDLPMPFDRRWSNPRRRKGEFHHSLKPVRRWIQGEGCNHFDCHSKDYFMLISYNILGDNNASKHGELYHNIPLDIMNWNSRKRFIFHEIDSLNGDLLCLQEVDNYEDISAYLKRKGYIGHYKRRTGWAKDGCALFWKAERFKLLEADNIEFRSFGLRDNVAQLLVFELSKGNPRRLVVGNIHVLFNPKRGDIKLGQIYRFLLKATQLSEKWGGIPVVLAGDFNSTPKSAIYDFLLTSKLKVDMRNRRKFLEQNNFQFASCNLSALNYYWTGKELANGSPHSLITHDLNLQSSYATIKSTAMTRDYLGEPLATSYHSKFLGTVDYIWYSTGLTCTRVLDTLPLDTLRMLGGLPCQDIGSDHLSLVAELVFTESKEIEIRSTDESSNDEGTVTSKVNLK